MLLSKGMASRFVTVLRTIQTEPAFKTTLEEIGATVLSNACGPCIGQWDRRELKGEENGELLQVTIMFRLTLKQLF